MARTGYIITVYQDINPSSPTYNTTREDREQDLVNCPTSGSSNWIEYTRYCEMNERGMNSGYEIIIYMDVEPLSPTYNETREERVQNTTDCPEDAATANWQNIGEPFCRQIVYLPGGLLGNDGYMVQQQQDMNEYSETADQIRDIATQDLEDCPLPNTEPVWDIISESCHIVLYEGELVYNGTKDVVRVNTNQYSPTWNNNIPETANIPDPINCPSDIEVQYRWITVGDDYLCDGYNKYALQKKQQSFDGGQTWTDVSPLETMAGYLIEENSEDCGYVPPIPPSTQYRWVTVSDTYECISYDKYTVEKKQQSTDGGETWTDVSPLETRAGEVLEVNSLDCGYVPPTQYRWVTVSGQYTCVDYDKYTVQKKQQSVDNGHTWTDVVPSETRAGTAVEYNSEYCGYVPPTPTQYRWVVVSGEYICVGYNKHTKEKKQQSIDGGINWTDVSPLETRAGALVEANSEYCGYVIDYSTHYLTFESLADDNEIYLSTRQTGSKQVFISTDDGQTWTEKTAANLVVLATLNRGEKMLIKANNETYSKKIGNNYDYSHFQVRKPYNLSGNIMSLVYGDNFIGQTTLNSTYTFYHLFSGLMEYEGITGTLVSAGNLVLPATSNYCYYQMFITEGRLTTPPKLTATTLAEGCYRFMFAECTSLSITPTLSATTMADYSYASMFQGCTSLTTPTALPATTLATGCYYAMYEGCTSLTTAPALPVTSLATSCYRLMFYGCTSLTTAPELPATTLVSDCYTSMFYGCTSLNYIKALFTTEPNTTYTANWVANVAANGTFVKNPLAEWTAWIARGQNTIPDNWSIINA